MVPLGYVSRDKKLFIEEEEAERNIMRCFADSRQLPQSRDSISYGTDIR